MNKVLLPNINTIIQKLFALSNKWKNDYMMSRTHGQPAVTTSMGKEIMVFVNRLKIQYSKLLQINYTTKLVVQLEILMHMYFVMKMLIGKDF